MTVFVGGGTDAQQNKWYPAAEKHHHVRDLNTPLSIYLLPLLMSVLKSNNPQPCNN
jgi:hypothetical protein